MVRKKTEQKSALIFQEVDIKYLGSREEPAEERTVESRQRLRDSLQSQIDEFLRNGGQIQQLPINATAHNLKKTIDSSDSCGGVV